MAFEKTQLMTLFPTFVWSHDLAAAEAGPLNDQLAASIERLIAPRPEILPGQTWQTHHDLHERPEFAALVRIIVGATRGVLEFLQAEPDPFEITGCWANVNPQGAHHNAHSHPNNFLSGVYYVRSGAGADSIRFTDPRPQTLQVSPRYRERGPTNAYEAFVNVPEGRLVIFPAWLSHSVPTNVSGRDRMSVSFNIMFSDFARTQARPKWQGIGAGGGGAP